MYNAHPPFSPSLPPPAISGVLFLCSVKFPQLFKLVHHYLGD